MQRIEEIRRKLYVLNLDCFLVSNVTNIRYLTGFISSRTERESYLVIRQNKSILIVSGMYREEARALKAKGFTVDFPLEDESLLKSAVSLLSGKVGFEAQDIKYSEYEALEKKLKIVKPVKNLIENLRVIKDKNEIQKIKRVVQITDKVFSKILTYIKPGQTEFEIAQKIHGLALEYGGEDISFPSIVAFGVNSFKPHYHTGSKKIRKGSLLLLDFGVKYKGYCGDLTRTIYIGEPDRKFRTIYKAVLNAQNEAIKVIRPGVKTEIVHDAVIKVFKKHRLENKFIHSTGHGIGLDVHELPSLNTKSDAVLKEGMVITIEPGIYVRDWGGIRIEDIVLVTRNGSEVLSQSPTNLF